MLTQERVVYVPSSFLSRPPCAAAARPRRPSSAPQIRSRRAAPGSVRRRTSVVCHAGIGFLCFIFRYIAPHTPCISSPSRLAQSSSTSFRGNHQSKTTCLTLLVQHTVSSRVANTVATYGDPWHDEPRVKRTRPHQTSSVRQGMPPKEDPKMKGHAQQSNKHWNKQTTARKKGHGARAARPPRLPSGQPRRRRLGLSQVGTS